MKISDVIAEFINNSLAAENEVVLQRGELALMFDCAPSQINYVIGTRFSPEMGYFVESRRGGGGYIRITRANLAATVIMHAVNSIGECIDFQAATAIIENISACGAMDTHIGQILCAAIGDQALATVPQSLRPALRARILKASLAACAAQ